MKPKSEPNEAMERQIIDIFGSWIYFGDIGAVSEEESKSVSLLCPTFTKVGLWEDPETRVCKN